MQQRREISEDRAKLDDLRSKCKIREETYKIEIEKLRQKLDKIRCKFEQQQKQRQNSQEMHRLKEENMLLKSQQSFQTSKLLLSASDTSPPKQLERSPEQYVPVDNCQASSSSSKIKKQLATTDMELVKLAQHKLMKENKSLKKRVDLMQGQMKEIFEILVDEKTSQSLSQPILTRIPLDQQQQQQRKSEQKPTLVMSNTKDDDRSFGAFSERIEVTKSDFLKKIKTVFEKHQSQNDIFLLKSNQMKEEIGSKLFESDSSDLSSCIDSASVSDPSQPNSSKNLNQQAEPLTYRGEALGGIDPNAFQRNKNIVPKHSDKEMTNEIPFDQKVAQIIREQKNPQKQQIAIPSPVDYSQKHFGDNLNQLSSRSRQASQHKEYNIIEGPQLRATFQGNGEPSRKGSELRSIKEQYQSVLNSQNNQSISSNMNLQNAIPVFSHIPTHQTRLYDHTNQFQVPKHYNSTVSPFGMSQPNTLITTNYTSFQANGGVPSFQGNPNLSSAVLSIDTKRNNESLPINLIDSFKKEGSLTSRTFEKSPVSQINEKITDEYIKQIIQQYKTPKKTPPTIIPAQTSNQASKKTFVVVPPVEIPQFISSNQPRGMLSARGAYERDSTGLLSSSSAQISPNRISKTSRISIQQSTTASNRPTSIASQNFHSVISPNQQTSTQNIVSLVPSAQSSIPLSREASLSYNCYFSNQPNTMNTSPINKKIISINPGPITNVQLMAPQGTSICRDQFNLNHKRQQSCGTQAGVNKYNLKLNLTSLASPKQSYQYSDRQYSDRPVYNNLISQQKSKQNLESISISHSPIFSPSPHSQLTQQINRFSKK